MDAHHLAELRSLALHREIARRIRRDPTLVDRARRTVERWRTDGRAPFYAKAWESLLSSSLERICEALVSEGEDSRALRQATPFAGVIEPRERWRIWRQVRSAHETP
jgi:hypothetical protein